MKKIEMTELEFGRSCVNMYREGIKAAIEVLKQGLPGADVTDEEILEFLKQMEGK